MNSAQVRLAVGVEVSQLPFGGAVLVDGATLSILECGEREQRTLDGLLAGDVESTRAGRSGAAEHVAEQLLRSGWLERRRAGGGDVQ